MKRRIKRNVAKMMWGRKLYFLLSVIVVCLPVFRFKLNDILTAVSKRRFRPFNEDNDKNFRHELRSVQDNSCDNECRKLHNFLSDRWPSDKPRAMIYYLTKGSRYMLLAKSLNRLYENFNERFRYPVVIFYEESDREFNVTRLRSVVNHSIFFQKLRFEVPSFIDKDRIPKYACSRYGIGYRHMCRFHAYAVYHQPVMFSMLQYLWRLDDDSVIKKPISYDLFRFMRDKELAYGYVLRRVEPACVGGLIKNVDVYIRNMSIKPTFYREIRHGTLQVYYNNFEISKQAFWQSDDYQNFINYIDRRGGIYFKRWGDAPIKTIAVSLFLNKSVVHHFKDISYKHTRA